VVNSFFGARWFVPALESDKLSAFQKSKKFLPAQTVAEKRGTYLFDD